jgi:hypothetical protein
MDGKLDEIVKELSELDTTTDGREALAAVQASVTDG